MMEISKTFTVDFIKLESCNAAVLRVYDQTPNRNLLLIDWLKNPTVEAGNVPQ